MAQDSLLVTEGSRTRSTPCCCCRRACSTAAGTPRAALARGRCQCLVTSIRLPARTTRKPWLGRHRQRGARMASGLPRSSLPRRGTAGRVAAMARRRGLERTSAAADSRAREHLQVGTHRMCSIISCFAATHASQVRSPTPGTRAPWYKPRLRRMPLVASPSPLSS